MGKKIDATTYEATVMDKEQFKQALVDYMVDTQKV